MKIESVPSNPARRELHRDSRSQRRLGQAVRSTRLSKGLTQVALGQRSELHSTWISNIESGHVNVTWGNLRRIAVGLGIDIEQLTSLITDYEMADAVAAAVRDLRQQQGFTRAIIAERAGLRKGQLAEIERGAAEPVSEKLEAKLRRGLRVQRKRWALALERGKDDLGIIRGSPLT